ncbi:tail fiber domain-containing protein [Pseudomonas sp. PSKL.D1]|uniref:tail fiber domain-containing protein n=1 Tax=Pseudomonas sp. PSKL.D1 TaxID=3029060 RepID=UPI00238117F1|nr:tail fiber domain-containing protein [Pseudomonas sp. PSKL.D1]WDY60402.1 tail fiber domain-containing protein [Pseudomonas sp. PSKL.D1]
MTVSTTDSVIEYVSGGPAYPIPYRFLQNSDIQAVLVKQDGTSETLVLGTQYTLTGAGAQSGGTLTSAYAALYLATPGATITISRVMSAVQPTDLRNQGRFLAETHETVFDRLTMLIQQGISNLRRALLRPIGRNYYDAEGRLIKNLADGGDDQDAVNIRTMRSYVDAAIAGVVGGFGWFLQSGMGAVFRTFQDKMRDSISTSDFGSIGDGTYHPLSERFGTLSEAQAQYPFATSLSQSIDWAAWQAACNAADGKGVQLRGKLVPTDTIDTASALFIRGDCAGDWTPGYNELISDAGTQALFYGTGPKVHTVDHISDRSTAGGVIANPSAADPYTANAPAPLYKLLNFTNGDAVGVTKATLKPFSVGIYRRKGCRFENFRIAPYFNGVAGYQDSETGGLGSNWDVGVWDESARATSDSNFQAVGYWRIAGMLKTCSQASPLIAPVAETSAHYRSTFQGFRGVAIRANDVYRVTAVTSNTIEIPWSPSHRFNLTGTVRVLGIEYSYTGLSFASDKLTFTGVSPASGSITLGSELRVGGSNFGTSGSNLDDCYITGLEHSSRMLATCNELESPFDSPSAAIEIDGSPVRAIQLPNSTVITREDILVFATNIGDLVYGNTYFESQAGRSSLSVGIFTGDIPAGSRMIYQRASTSLRSPYPAGGTVRLIAGTGTVYGPGVDRRPDFASSATPSRYASGSGLAEARDYVDFTGSFPTTSDGDITMEAPNRHVRIRPTPGGSVFLGPTSGDADVQSAVGSLNLRSGLRVRIGPAGNGTTYWYLGDSAKWTPTDDNLKALGQPSSRWSVVYAGTGTINTSDAREKTEVRPLSSNEISAAIDLAEQIGAYKWLAAIETKGQNAREHIGMTVQKAIEILECHGLDAFGLGFICYDEWGSTPEELDADGFVTGPATEGGDRFSFRMDELYAFIVSGLYWSFRKMNEDFESRIAKLEEK